MFENDIKKYNVLNDIAVQNGIVIFGGKEDKDIPLCELRQAFAIDSKLYNRSVDGLSVINAITLYDACAAPLIPETLLLHIGEADLNHFEENPADFDQKYRELIAHIRLLNKKCRIAVISLKNYGDDADIAEMNRHLKYIAESEHCEFGDIAAKRIWNPKGTKDVVSFVYDIGFIRPLKNKRPIYDLVKILFCCEE